MCATQCELASVQEVHWHTDKRSAFVWHWYFLHSTAIRVYAQARYALRLHLFTDLLYNDSQITQATAIVEHPPLPSVLWRIAFWLLPPVPCQRRLAVEHLPPLHYCHFLKLGKKRNCWQVAIFDWWILLVRECGCGSHNIRLAGIVSLVDGNIVRIDIFLAVNNPCRNA